jgi:hypothetical protein
MQTIRSLRVELVYKGLYVSLATTVALALTQMTQDLAFFLPRDSVTDRDFHSDIAVLELIFSEPYYAVSAFCSSGSPLWL